MALSRSHSGMSEYTAGYPGSAAGEAIVGATGVKARLPQSDVVSDKITQDFSQRSSSMV